MLESKGSLANIKLVVELGELTSVREVTAEYRECRISLDYPRPSFLKALEM
jgi:hypothetical protein